MVSSMKVGVLALLFLLLPQVQLLHVGRISKIDTKAGVITIKERLYPERGRGRGVRPPDLGADFPRDIPPSRGRGSRREIETKIFYSADTVFTPAQIADLKVGDSVQVTGKPYKDSLLATRIEKLSRD